MNRFEKRLDNHSCPRMIFYKLLTLILCFSATVIIDGNPGFANQTFSDDSDNAVSQWLSQYISPSYAAAVTESLVRTDPRLIDDTALAASRRDDSTDIWLAATGDIMFHGPQIKAAYRADTDTYDFKKSFANVAPYLNAADYTMGNFETTTASREKGFSGYPAFNAPDATLDAIKWAGYDFLTTANNHCLDRGLFGIERTIEQMRLREIAQSGTFLQAETEAPRYHTTTVKGIKLAIFAVTYGCNGLEQTLSETALHQAVNLIDETKMAQTLQAIEETDVDQTIVFIHWGNEYRRTPTETQEALAQKLVDWGADIILGSHPHVVERSEILYHEGDPKYVIYSMGNFISNQSRQTLTSIGNAKYTENGIIVYLRLTKSKDGTALTAVRHIPTWVSRSNELKYVILPIEKQASYTETPAIYQYTADAYEDTMSMMTPDADY
ncbi:CapA family protein [Fusibacter paucivorans]|uniref:CapA family protein n=1 Tax=Fusibacter paucivorans TaxID=76009 RepID=A0ABS5PNS0_9FIRM|nr:CapA family protein [Fusibacter paucivorans]MBS7526572.1 CapA family protein [Fusibacter paucivorans]